MLLNSCILVNFAFCLCSGIPSSWCHGLACDMFLWHCMVMDIFVCWYFIFIFLVGSDF